MKIKLSEVVFFDFETYSKADLSMCGGFVYASHPSTSTLCIAAVYKNKKLLLYPGEVVPAEWIKIFNDPKITKIAHNLLFDFWIWNEVFIDEQGALGNKTLKKLKIENCYDSMASAYYYGYPGALEKVAKAMKFSELKFAAGRQAMLTLSRLGKEAPNYSEKLNLVGQYCLGDVEILKKIMQSLGYIDDELEREIYLISMRMTIKGIAIDREGVRTILNAFHFFSTNSDDLVSKLSDGAMTRSDLNRVAFFRDYLQDQGLNAPNCQKGTLEKLLTSLEETLKKLKPYFNKRKIPGKEVNAIIPYNINTKQLKGSELKPIYDKIKNLRNLIQFRMILGKASINKLVTMDAMSSVTGRASGALQYHGAHTGRFSGRGFQPQNIPNKTLSDEELVSYFTKCGKLVSKKSPALSDLPLIEDMPKTLRRLLIAEKGKILVMADYKQIEARVIAWLAGQEDLCREFEKKEADIYSQFAETIYNHPVNKDDHPDERQVGKVGILGLGFGMGNIMYNSFCDTVQRMTGIFIEPEEGNRIVELYRQTYHRIAGFWPLVEKMFRLAINFKKTFELELSYSGVTLFFGWEKKIDGVFIQLPAGRKLYYPNCFISPKDDIHYLDKKVYGGLLSENITQAVARDIMTWAMKKLPGAILTVHDELVWELPLAKADLKTITHKLRTIACPAWFDKNLIGIDIKKGVRYDK